MEFRKSKSPYELCRYILGKATDRYNFVWLYDTQFTNLLIFLSIHFIETSKDQYLLFQAVSTLQEACVREWSLLTPSLITELQNFLLNFVLNSGYLEKFVQRQVLLTIAVFYKRCKLDTNTSHANLPANRASLDQNDTPKFTTNIVKDIIALFKTANVQLVN